MSPVAETELNWEVLKRPKLTREERAVFQKAALSDFKVFCRIVGPPKWDFESERSGHTAIADALCLQDKSTDGIIRIHIQAPRKGGKSALSQRHAAWRICRSIANWSDEPFKNGSIRILYATENVEKTNETGDWVHRVLSDPNSNLVKIFGQIVNPHSSIMRWTTLHRVHPHPEPTWIVGTPGKSTAGKHPTLIYADDTETDQSTRTLPSMMKRRRWLDELEAELETDGEFRVLGTPYDDNDLYSYIYEKGSTWKCFLFHVQEYTFLGLTEEFLEGKRLIMPLWKYSASYMLDPLPAAVRVFTREMFRLVKFDERIKALPRYMLLDVAASEDGPCETAMWVVAKDSVDTAYGIDVVHGKFEPELMLNYLVALFGKWNLCWFCAEDRVLTKFLEELVRQKERLANVHLPFHIISGKRYPGKDLHIRSLRPRFVSHTILFCDTLPKEEMREIRANEGDAVRMEGNVVRAFTRFPRGKLKDVADALAHIDGRDQFDAPLVPTPVKQKSGDWVPETRVTNPWRFPAWRRAGRHGSHRRR